MNNSLQPLTGARGDILLFTQQQQQQRPRINGIDPDATQSGGRSADLNGAGDPTSRQPLLQLTADASKHRPNIGACRINSKMTSASDSNGGGGVDSGGDKSKRKKIMTRARKHPTVDKIITVLQDKRVDDDQADQIQDLQLPMLRKVLNVIFIALGVVFLLGVIIVIIYTSLGKDEFNRKH